ncbi:hypothetical protein PTKIN_Ptkin13bG0237500 [Pterospermum kingtungense]
MEMELAGIEEGSVGTEHGSANPLQGFLHSGNVDFQWKRPNATKWIVKIQTHSRIKAIREVRDCLRSINAGTLEDFRQSVFVPLMELDLNSTLNGLVLHQVLHYKSHLIA